MKRIAQHRVLAVAVVAAVIALAGCSITSRAPLPSGDAGGHSSASQVGPGSLTADLKGLVVTVEITASPGPDLSRGRGEMQTPAPPRPGMTRMTLYSKALNSTGQPLDVRFEHNFPTLQDAGGTFIRSLDDARGRVRGPHGGDLVAGRSGLRPGGTIETVQSFDVRPGQAGLKYTWDFGDLGTARFTLPIVATGRPGDFAASLKGVSLAEALREIGRYAPLPNEAIAGPLGKVVVDQTAGDPLQGNPGLFLIYRSGVRLTVNRRARDLSELGKSTIPFTDGRKTHFEPREINRTKVLVGRAGLQKTSHGDNEVPPMLLWNQSGLGYTLVGPTQDFAIDDLIAIMKSTK